MVWPPFISGRERGAKFRSLPCLLCDVNCLVGKGRAPPRTGFGRGGGGGVSDGLAPLYLRSGEGHKVSIAAILTGYFEQFVIFVIN